MNGTDQERKQYRTARQGNRIGNGNHVQVGYFVVNCWTVDLTLNIYSHHGPYTGKWDKLRQSNRDKGLVPLLYNSMTLTMNRNLGL